MRIKARVVRPAGLRRGESRFLPGLSGNAAAIEIGLVTKSARSKLNLPHFLYAFPINGQS
jgi:hypothetical protein